MPHLNLLLTVLLAAVVVAVGVFIAMAVLQHRRSRHLGRRAHEMGMHFSLDDPFEVPRRYSDFAVISSGHSPRATNVIYGQTVHWPVRAFDFRYEVGHGTSRASRSYLIMVVEMNRPMPRLLMWNSHDREHLPLSGHLCDQELGPWCFRGNRKMAEALAEACGGLADQGISMQTLNQAVMIMLPISRRSQDYLPLIALAERIALSVEAAADRSGEGENPRHAS